MKFFGGKKDTPDRSRARRRAGRDSQIRLFQPHEAGRLAHPRVALVPRSRPSSRSPARSMNPRLKTLKPRCSPAISASKPPPPSSMPCATAPAARLSKAATSCASCSRHRFAPFSKLPSPASPALRPGGPPNVTFLVGVNGTGKTTSSGKLAAWHRAQNRTVLLCAADTFRAAAIEQLEVWASRSGVEMIKTRQGGDPAAVLYDAVTPPRRATSTN